MRQKKSLKILKIDPYLQPYEEDLRLRMRLFEQKKTDLVGNGSLVD